MCFSGSLLILDSFDTCPYIWWAARNELSTNLLLLYRNDVKVFVVANSLLMLLLLPIINRIQGIILHRLLRHRRPNIDALHRWWRLGSMQLSLLLVYLLLLFFQLVENIISYLWMPVVSGSELASARLISWVLSSRRFVLMTAHLRHHLPLLLHWVVISFIFFIYLLEVFLVEFMRLFIFF